jgi:hypothetical protein
MDSSALRSRGIRRMHRIERASNAAFIVAMVVMVAICEFLTYAVSAPIHS